MLEHVNQENVLTHEFMSFIVKCQMCIQLLQTSNEYVAT